MALAPGTERKHNLPLSQSDPEMAGLLEKEAVRQQDNLELIASENIASLAVRQAMMSALTDKYAEGYPGKRYYGGCEVADEVERLANARAMELYGAGFANLQPHSGASANMAVYHALLKPGDTLMAMSLDQGGHLTHGSPVNFSGQLYQVAPYGVREKDERIDYDAMRKLAYESKPKVIVSGATAYPFEFDFAEVRKIADEVDAIHMCDMSHYSGLIAAGVYPSPFGHAHLVTSTTHKSIRGPRGGMILGDKKFEKAINKAVFPGLQGGPLMHVIAAKGVAFAEALRPSFKDYARQIKANAHALGQALSGEGFRLVGGGTESHLLLVDLRPFKVTGKIAQEALEKASITCNKNTIPFDPESPFVTSGIRLGTPALTTRGMKETEMQTVGKLIADVLRAPEDADNLNQVRGRVRELTERFPLDAL